MHIWKRIRGLSIQQLFQLGILLLKNPLKIIPTLQATKRTFAICNQLFAAKHNAANQANAFRHALWNALLCKKVHKLTHNKQKSVFWAQKVTDLYEKVTQNDTLDKAMDLHNNSCGRIYFFNNLSVNEQELVDFIQKKAKKAKKIAISEEIIDTPTQLVYLHD